MRLQRFGAGIAAFAAGAALVISATPALAEPTTADVQFTVVSDSVARLASKPFYVQLFNAGPATAENVVVKIDLGGLDTDVVQVEEPVGCAVNDTVYTCALGSLVAGEHANDFSVFSVTSIDHAGPEPGPAGTFTVEVTSDTPDSNPDNNKAQTLSLNVVRTAYDVVAIAYDVWAGPPSDDDRERVAPGKVAPFVFFLANHGKQSVHGVTWTISLPPYVTFPAEEKHAACTFNATRTQAYCERPDQQLDPDETYTLVNPMKVQVAADAPGPVALTGGLIAGGSLNVRTPPSTAVAANAKTVTVGDAKIGPATAEQKDLIEADPEDDASAFSVFTSANGADLAVTGGSGSGAVGSTVSIPVKAKNNGPASSPSTKLTVTAPSGTELVDLPTGCTFDTAGVVGVCDGLLAAGTETVQTFTFKILSDSVGANGKAEISGPLDDANEANNAASISISVTGGLPITGTNVWLIGGVGVAALVLGAVLIFASRRHRPTLVTPDREA